MLQPLEKNYLTTLLLCLFFGHLGIHRFYNRKLTTALLMLFTFGGLGIWAIIDLILIIIGWIKDKRASALRTKACSQLS